MPAHEHHGQNGGFTASRLAAMGLHPFALRAPNSGDPNAFKRPAYAGWQAEAEACSPETLALLDEAKCNLGLSLGPSRLVVVDTDTPEAEDWAAAHLPKTPWMVRTAHGWHRYYRLPDDADPPRNGKPIPGIDIKAAGGYTVALGSWHYAEEMPYAPEGDWTVSIDQLPIFDPAWFPAKLKPVELAAPVNGKHHPGLDAQREQEVIAYLSQCAPAIQGQGGQTTLFETAMKCRTALRLDLESTRRMLWNFYNPRCVPPWGPDEFEEFLHHVTDGWNQGAEPVGAESRTGPTVSRLAAMPELDYAQVRKAEAKRLGVRVRALDKAVEEARGEGQQGGGTAVSFPEIEPWPDSVDAGELLDEIATTVRRYIICDPETATAVALWVAFTWLINHVQVAPIALITSPERRCGKTQLLNLIQRLVLRPLVASNITPAALFRTVETYQPTLLIDEVDSFLKDSEELRGIVNSGHTRQSAFVIRTIGESFEPRQFSTWGAKALCGIGQLAGTIMDRSIVLPLRRRLKTERVERLRHADPGYFETLACKLARLAQDHGQDIAQARPDLPDALNDRAQDNWEPLLAIADLAGSAWPSRARNAALRLTGAEQEDGSTSTELLRDIKAIFDTGTGTRGKGADAVGTSTLLGKLVGDDLGPWATYLHGRPMTARQLGKRLGEFGIESVSLKFPGGVVVRGYKRSQFLDAWSRYLDGKGPRDDAPQEVKIDKPQIKSKF
jgi:putative DNA primase/helicase